MGNDFNDFVKKNWKRLLTEKQQKYYQDMILGNSSKYSKQLRNHYNVAIRKIMLKAYEESKGE